PHGLLLVAAQIFDVLPEYRTLIRALKDFHDLRRAVHRGQSSVEIPNNRYVWHCGRLFLGFARLGLVATRDEPSRRRIAMYTGIHDNIVGRVELVDREAFLSPRYSRLYLSHGPCPPESCSRSLPGISEPFQA